MITGKDFIDNMRNMREPTMHQINRLNQYINGMNREIEKPRPDLNWYHAQLLAYRSVIENMRYHQVFIPELYLRYYKKLEAV